MADKIWMDTSANVPAISLNVTRTLEQRYDTRRGGHVSDRIAFADRAPGSGVRADR